VGDVARHYLGEETIRCAERDARACRLRAQGHDWQEIADELGYNSKGHARDAVRRALLETLQAPADELRAVELLLHEQAIRKCFDIINAPQPLLDRAGRPVTLLGEDGEEYACDDQGIIVQALNALQKFSESRRKMMGLDAPIKTISANARITLSDLQEMAIANGVPAEEVYATVKQLPGMSEQAAPGDRAR